MEGILNFCAVICIFLSYHSLAYTVSYKWEKVARQINGNGTKDQLAGGVCPVAGRHSFFYEGRIPVMGLGGISPLFRCAVLLLEGDPVCVAIYTAALTGSPVLVLADAWSGMIACR